MPDRGLWRSESAYAYIDALDPPGMAWEFLRRNSAYQEDFTTATAPGPLSGSVALAIARKWGMPFCDGSRAHCAGSLCLLDPRRRPGDHPDIGGADRDG